MSLENEVPSLALCQEWKRIGGRQDTLFKWAKHNEWYENKHQLYFSKDCQEAWEEVAAPLASELMEWLPERFYKSTKEFEEVGFILTVDKDEDGYTVYYENHGIPIDEDMLFTDKSLPNALMQMAIEKEKKEKR